MLADCRFDVRMGESIRGWIAFRDVNNRSTRTMGLSAEFPAPLVYDFKIRTRKYIKAYRR